MAGGRSEFVRRIAPQMAAPKLTRYDLSRTAPPSPPHVRPAQCQAAALTPPFVSIGGGLWRSRHCGPMRYLPSFGPQPLAWHPRCTPPVAVAAITPAGGSLQRNLALTPAAPPPPLPVC